MLTECNAVIRVSKNGGRTAAAKGVIRRRVSELDGRRFLCSQKKQPAIPGVRDSARQRAVAMRRWIAILRHSCVRTQTVSANFKRLHNCLRKK